MRLAVACWTTVRIIVGEPNTYVDTLVYGMTEDGIMNPDHTHLK